MFPSVPAKLLPSVLFSTLETRATSVTDVTHVNQSAVWQLYKIVRSFV